MARSSPRPSARLQTWFSATDHALFDAVAHSDNPVLDEPMRRLTRSANHSKLWMGVAAALWVFGSRSARRGAVRGMASLAATSLVTNQGAKRLRWRSRPVAGSVPRARIVRTPTSSSMPSGHSASAAAFAVGVAAENRTLGLALAPLAGLVGLSRVATGAHYPGDVAVGFGIGAGIALGLARMHPTDDEDHRPPTPESTRVPVPPRPDGEGVVLVVNPASGGGTGERIIDKVRRSLPAAEIVTIGSGDDVEAILRSAAARADVIAIGGGDGSVATAAAIALDTDTPLAVFPGGTFNHFARDIGCPTIAETVSAIERGTAAYVDVIRLNGSAVIVNTASIGAYPRFVRTRERLEHTIGKPLASVYATLSTVRRERPVRISFNGTTARTSLLFVGNSQYRSGGFAPTQRFTLDDGLLDVRVIDVDHRFATTRILAALAVGRIERSALYHRFEVPEFTVTSLDGQTLVAHDGEVGDYLRTAHFEIVSRSLAVYRPLPVPDDTGGT
ncbi:bifunctional phosphatase PAP2/diacylglycerol kinase family protein [Williamsia maris]|uniref:Undecaprenyl-diphosphatase n=1 Tax=Williamsia maris TaxID=72806 RepID=A0ABT1HBJ8_9NOCA|nr:bifunctional phosphatase PAP2/diacylglycerol kinase family protein [Williamsia maris]MCP2175633.1 undecaprenyl-diphosphatase [Williamsia maris]